VTSGEGGCDVSEGKLAETKAGMNRPGANSVYPTRSSTMPPLRTAKNEWHAGIVIWKSANVGSGSSLCQPLGRGRISDCGGGRSQRREGRNGAATLAGRPRAAERLAASDHVSKECAELHGLQRIGEIRGHRRRSLRIGKRPYRGHRPCRVLIDRAGEGGPAARRALLAAAARELSAD